MTPVIALTLLAPAVIAAQAQAPEWQKGAPLPDKRTEVAAAVVNGEIAVVGGFLPDGSSSNRVDLYSPARDSWRRLPNLPVGVNHSMAAGYRGRLYVVGGYVARGQALRGAYMLDRGRWRALPRPPEERAAGGAAIVADKLYVAGGVGPGGLAKRMLVLDLKRGRWSTAPSPTAREHLAVTAHGGKVYAVAGRTAGIDTNNALLESYTPGSRGWTRLAPVPDSRGGTGAATLGGEIVSVGGEEPEGTIRTVYAYTVASKRWRRLDDLPTPRHGLGVTALGGRVYAIAGGEKPGLFVSDANEFLQLR